VTLLRGDRPPSVVLEEDVVEFARRRPYDRTITLAGGHSLQGDDPLRVARVLGDVLSGSEFTP
jgi:hypothetical protein